MTTSNRNAINLQLPILPDITGIDEEVYSELVRLYNAVNLIAASVDVVTGLYEPTDEEILTYVAENNVNNCLLKNVTKIYMEFLEPASKGHIISRDYTTGKACKAGTFYSPDWVPLGGAVRGNVIGILNSESVEAGEFGEICLAGVCEYPMGGLVTGKAYSLVWQWTVLTPPYFPLLGEVIRTDSVFNADRQERVGVAIAPNVLVFNLISRYGL